MASITDNNLPDDLVELLRESPLLSGLTIQDSELLTTIIRHRSALKGEILFEEGEAATGFFLLRSGKVKVYKLSPEGKEHILHVVQPGQTFADAAIFDEGVFPAFAEALTSSSLLFFPRGAFLDLLQSHPQLSINMIAGMSRYLRQFARHIEDLTFRDVPARLARYLQEEGGAQQVVVELPISKSQLAANLGTTSESLSRSLRKLADDDILAVRGKTIEILDRERLSDLAQTLT